MNQKISAMYWNQHKDMCLEILSNEFQGEDYAYHLFLPSNYLGDYATFSLFSLDNDQESTFIRSFATLGEVIEHFTYSLKLI
jgi:hypothetical protein